MHRCICSLQGSFKRFNKVRQIPKCPSGEQQQMVPLSLHVHYRDGQPAYGRPTAGASKSEHEWPPVVKQPSGRAERERESRCGEPGQPEGPCRRVSLPRRCAAKLSNCYGGGGGPTILQVGSYVARWRSFERGLFSNSSMSTCSVFTVDFSLFIHKFL